VKMVLVEPRLFCFVGAVLFLLGLELFLDCAPLKGAFPLKRFSRTRPVFLTNPLRLLTSPFLEWTGSQLSSDEAADRRERILLSGHSMDRLSSCFLSPPL